MPKLVRFGERQHIIQDVTGPFRPANQPVVALCGTVFRPKTWDPDPEMDQCLGCVKMQEQYIVHYLELLESELSEVQKQLADHYLKEK